MHPCVSFQVPTDVSSSQGATILTHDLFTNNVVYMETALDMKNVPLHLIPLVPLFCRSLTNMATEVSKLQLFPLQPHSSLPT
jgi:Zn-dependent M16 (insulinase) family peptidase